MRNVLTADWPAPPNVHTLVTTREGGFSQGPWASMNLSMAVGDDPACVMQNRDLLARRIPADPPWLTQVHGVEVIENDGIQCGSPEGDAMIAFGPGRVCSVLTADCLPVLFCNRSGDCVAAAHAGWRGLADGVLEATVRAMAVEPGEILAWMGPAIGPDAFEVGQDVADAFDTEFPRGFKASGDRWLLDLYEVARIRLGRVGVTAVYGGGLCTFSDPERWYSFRREEVTGRMASLVWLD